MHIVLQYFVDHMGEVVTLGAITIVVFALVVGLGDGYIEPGACFLNVLRNFGQVREFQWGPVLFDEVHHGDSMEFKVVVAVKFEFFRREVKSLVDEVNVLVFHGSFLFFLEKVCKGK